MNERFEVSIATKSISIASVMRLNIIPVLILEYKVS